MPSISPPATPSADTLFSACEECISCLTELVGIHIAIDPADRVVESTDPECVYRLRKALLHVTAIIRWTLSTDVMHVIAPEIRAAVDQIDPVLEDVDDGWELREFVQGQASPTARLQAKVRRESISSFVHPSPVGLLFPRESGGLVPGDDTSYYATMLYQLATLVFRYALAIDLLSLRRGTDHESAMTSILQRAGEVMASVTPGTAGASAAPESGDEPRRTEETRSEHRTE